ncbi:MAG: Protein FlxA [Candidatus Erwinia impunctatus]|nr:Protein FlxA [Culicoides impunctatus]
MTTLGISSASGSSGANSSPVSQVDSLNQQILHLENKLKSLGQDDTLTTHQKSEQQQVIQAQIEMILAQIAQLQHQQAAKAQEKVMQEKESANPHSIKADGVNRPTVTNSLDIYIYNGGFFSR